MLTSCKLNLKDEEKLLAVAKALSSPVRLDILKLLLFSSMNVKQIAQALNQPLSSTALNIQILEDAGLILSETTYNSQGKMRICYRQFDSVDIVLFDKDDELDQDAAQKTEITLPIGSFSSYEEISAPCGMAGKTDKLGTDDNPEIFYSPHRGKAELIWFMSGALEYRIPCPKNGKGIKRFEISFEACSEAPNYNNNFKSDITVWVNGVEIGTWVSPGDFGGRKGQFSPEYWPSNMTQYGMLTTWSVSETGTNMNNEFLSYVNVSNCKLKKDDLKKTPYISVKLGVKPDALHRGGINLFGKSFGDFSQDIVIRMIYE